LSHAGLQASIIGRVQPVEKGRVLVSREGTHSLPTFTRDEITRLF